MSDDDLRERCEIEQQRIYDTALAAALPESPTGIDEAVASLAAFYVLLCRW